MKTLRQSLCALGFFLVLVALYTGAVTGIAALALPRQAGGSLIVKEGLTRGSYLLGQNFDRADRFHGRPSASAYNPMGASASNLGPTSAALAKSLAERREALAKASAAQGGEGLSPPDDLLCASGSGLDPDISVEAALYQAPRVAAALGLGGKGLAEIEGLVAELRKGRTFGLLGEERLNVVELNLAIERLYGK